MGTRGQQRQTDRLSHSTATTLTHWCLTNTKNDHTWAEKALVLQHTPYFSSPHSPSNTSFCSSSLFSCRFLKRRSQARIDKQSKKALPPLLPMPCRWRCWCLLRPSLCTCVRWATQSAPWSSSSEAETCSSGFPPAPSAAGRCWSSSSSSWFGWWPPGWEKNKQMLHLYKLNKLYCRPQAHPSCPDFIILAVILRLHTYWEVSIWDRCINPLWV